MENGKNIERISADLEDVIVIGSASTETETVQTQSSSKSKAIMAACNHDFNDCSFVI